jgi:hypothetical protein
MARPDSKFLSRIGVGAIALFTIKGLAWLALPALGVTLCRTVAPSRNDARPSATPEVAATPEAPAAGEGSRTPVGAAGPATPPGPDAS